MTLRYQLPQLRIRRLGFSLLLLLSVFGTIAYSTQLKSATAQTSAQNHPLYVRGRIQEYNAKTQVATIRGDVELVYPARGIQATAAQAQYFTKEREIVLSGNVYVLQQGGNSIRAETVTYLIDQGRFVATPSSGGQVESVYIVNDTGTNNQSGTKTPATGK